MLTLIWEPASSSFSLLFFFLLQLKFLIFLFPCQRLFNLWFSLNRMIWESSSATSTAMIIFTLIFVLSGSTMIILRPSISLSISISVASVSIISSRISFVHTSWVFSVLLLIFMFMISLSISWSWSWFWVFSHF